MKVQSLLLATHSGTAIAVATMFVIASRSGTALFFTVASVLSIVTVAAVSWFVSARMRSGLSKLEAILSDHENPELLRTGIVEFDHSAKKIGEGASHWETVAANTRQQAHEIQSMMRLINHRGATNEPLSTQLRDLLAELGDTLHSQFAQIERGTSEVKQNTQTITDGSEAQGHAVIKTTTYVEQLSTTIDSVSANAASAHSAMGRTGQSASAALGLIQELIAGMKQVRTESQTCEKKLGGLCDPSQQISAIVGTISDIAARTDMLALNASIEAIRAGEHGRGFAIVADEVRKLAEQATDATQEISSLVDTMQLVTQESIHGIVREREQLDSEVSRATAAAQALHDICGTVDNDVKHIRQIADTSNQQLGLVRDVVLAIEQISTIAKANRGSAESVGWTMKSLSNTSPQFNAAIDRLKTCGGAAGSNVTEQPERIRRQSPEPNQIATNVVPAAPVAMAMSAANMIPIE